MGSICLVYSPCLPCAGCGSLGTIQEPAFVSMMIFGGSGASFDYPSTHQEQCCIRTLCRGQILTNGNWLCRQQGRVRTEPGLWGALGWVGGTSRGDPCFSIPFLQRTPPKAAPHQEFFRSLCFSLVLCCGSC